MWREFIQTLEPSATFFPPATEQQLAKLETAINVALPDELRHLLMESNGVRGEYGLRLIWSIEEIIEENQEKRTNAIYMVNALKCEQLLRLMRTFGGKHFNKMGETIEFVLKESLISLR